MEENATVFRSLFTFDQLVSACNTQILIEKPFFLNSIPTDEVAINNQISDSIELFLTAFDLTTLLNQATQLEIMYLPTMGYTDEDPHSNTRLSFLLKSIQQQLGSLFEACFETRDQLLLSILLSSIAKHPFSQNNDDGILQRKSRIKRSKVCSMYQPILVSCYS